MTAYRIYAAIEQPLIDGTLFSGESDKNKKGLFKDIALAVGINIPNLAYSLWAGTNRVPEERIQNLKALIRSHTHLLDARLDGVADTFSNGRMNYPYIEDINFAVWNWQVVCYMLLIVFAIAAVLIFAGYWHRAIFYVMSSAFMMVCAYLLNFIGWDQERYKFGAAMMITFISIWLVKDLGTDRLIVNKDIIYICSLVTIVMFCMMDFRLGLFDGALYNASVAQFKETLRTTWRLNY